MRLIILGLFIVLSSCATTMDNYYSQTVESWRGGNINSLINRWGRPDERMSGPSGTTMYVYKTMGLRNANGPSGPNIGVHVSSSGHPVMTTTPNTNNWTRGGSTLNCVTAFVVNPKGIITEVNFEGPRCYANQTFQENKSNK